MPRCLPVAQKVKVTKVDNIHAEDELHAYLFTSEETEWTESTFEGEKLNFGLLKYEQYKVKWCSDCCELLSPC